MRPAFQLAPPVQDLPVFPSAGHTGMGSVQPKPPMHRQSSSTQKQGEHCCSQPQKAPGWHLAMSAQHRKEIKGTEGQSPVLSRVVQALPPGEASGSPLVVKCALGRGAVPLPPALIFATASSRAVLVENKAEDRWGSLFNYQLLVMLTEPLGTPRLEKRRKCRDTGKLLFNSSALHLTIRHGVDEQQEESDDQQSALSAGAISTAMGAEKPLLMPPAPPGHTGPAPAPVGVQCSAGRESMGQLCPSVLLLGVTAKELYPQGNVVVPVAGMYPHIAGKERRLQAVQHCAGVISVCPENLERREESVGCWLLC